MLDRVILNMGKNKCSGVRPRISSKLMFASYYYCCRFKCCLHIKSVFLPSFIISAPSVRPDYLSLRDSHSLWNTLCVLLIVRLRVLRTDDAWPLPCKVFSTDIMRMTKIWSQLQNSRSRCLSDCVPSYINLENIYIYIYIRRLHVLISLPPRPPAFSSSRCLSVTWYFISALIALFIYFYYFY